MPQNIELARTQWERFEYLKVRGHNAFVEKAARCESFFAGDQWEQADLDTLKAQRRPALTINKIISTLGTMMGEQIYNRNDTTFRPSTGARAETAESLSMLWKQLAQDNQLAWVRSELFCDGIIRSRGFVDIRLAFDDSMQGEVNIENLNSKNVLIDCDAEEYDPDRWNDVIVSKWMCPQDIEILYTKEDAEALRLRDGAGFSFGYDSIDLYRDRFGGAAEFSQGHNAEDTNGIRRNIRVLDRQHRKLDRYEHFVDLQTGDTRPVPSTWDRNKIASVLEKTQGRMGVIKKLAKRVRWTVTADDIVLHDAWSPYKHFTVVPYFPYFRYGRTIGLVENLLGSQELLNKVTSQELHVVNTTANSGWKLKAGSLKNMSIEELEMKGAQTGLVLELDDTASAEKITPNATPTGLDRISYKAEEHIKTISNVSDYQQGNAREDVSGKALQLNRQTGSVNMSKSMDNLSRTDFLIARNVIDIVQEYYTEPRIINITHGDLLKEPEALAVNQVDEATGEITNDLTIGEFDIIVSSTPYRDTLEDSQFEQAMAMKEAGVAIPDDVIVENSRLTRKADVAKRMQGDQTSPEALARKQLAQRMQTAEVELAEAKASQTRADDGLKQATTQKTLVGIGQADTKLAIDAQAGQGNPEQAAQEMALETQKANNEMTLEERKFQHETAMAERKMALEEQAHAQKLRLEEDMHMHSKQIASQKATAEAAATTANSIRKDLPPGEA